MKLDFNFVKACKETEVELDGVIRALGGTYPPVPPTPPGPSFPYGIRRTGGVTITDSLPIAFNLAPEPGWQILLQQQQPGQLVVVDQNNREWIFNPAGDGIYDGITVKTMTYMPEIVAWIDYSTLAITVLNQEYSIEWI